MSETQLTSRSGSVDFIPFWIATFVAVISVISTLLFSGDLGMSKGENGAIEIASAFLWLFAALAFLWLAQPNTLSSRWHVPLLFLLFCARELDFDKKFLSQGILKARLYSGDAPIVEKLIGLVVISVILVVVVRLVKRNWRDVLAGLRDGAGWAWTTMFAFGLAGFSKLIDGADRKLASFGVELPPSVNASLSVAEEVMELGFVVVTILALCLYERQSSNSART